MNTSGEVADLMVKEGIQITESAAKLAGLGAKNLAAIIMALLKDESRLQGKTNLKQLLKSDKPLCILQIKEADLKKFNSEAKKYGVLFTAVSDRANDTGLCDIIAKQEDVTKLNYIMEKLGYTASAAEEKKFDDREDAETQRDNASSDRSKERHEKNSGPRGREYRSEHRYTKRGDTERADRNIKSSVRDKITQIKAERSIGKTSGIERTAAKKGRDVSR
ncbi:MAG: PcfB family protein [Monoglobales bacterium]